MELVCPGNCYRARLLVRVWLSTVAKVGVCACRRFQELTFGNQTVMCKKSISKIDISKTCFLNGLR